MISKDLQEAIDLLLQRFKDDGVQYVLAVEDGVKCSLYEMASPAVKAYTAAKLIQTTL